MADNTRSLTIKNAGPNISAFFNSKYNLQVAKSLITNNQLTYNMVWQSHVLALNMNVEWKPVYGLDWTTEVPVLDLDAMGMWEQSTAIPKLRYLKVGKNKAQTDTGTNSVQFMVGVQEARYGFSPIFVDPAETGKGMTALYQPQEKVQWWY
ncbi:hypothetical protein HO173_011123 [Letharia columbiana]|uniref:Uncharacterized protein n=1 Tax=Letharia columbiana TaxID=112416 RepID=A0A8H6FL66_9LECA|nr:uncharacterized protein HO173_011123 [Letharia columbiana]KAF6230586.1 hypothetical protein HO173_011123 [Letharia columbiana]